MSDIPTITPSENGPLLVADYRMLKGLPDGKVYQSEGRLALCRCGGSKNKPYCDGTHKTNGFSGDEEPDRVPDQREAYVGARITIHDNRGICAHSARCTDTLKAAFRMRQEPWIDPRSDSVDAIIATVAQCPPVRSVIRSMASSTVIATAIR